MKKLVTNIKYILLVCVVAFSFACSTEDGAQGPQGEQGVPGVSGQDGNANVTSVIFENQTINDGNNVFTIPELTQDIYDNGFVYGYVTLTWNDFWEVLPVSSNGSIVLEIDRIEVGQVTLKSTFTQSNLRLRFILVAGTSTNRSAIDISKMSYAEAMAYFGLEI